LQLIIQSIINALITSSVNALVAVGLVLIFGVMQVVNFAHGALFMVGAYAVWFIYSSWGGPFPLAVIGAFVIVTALGLVMERTMFRPMRNNVLGGLINSLGVLFILQVLAVLAGGLGLMKNVNPAYRGYLHLPGSVFIPEQRVVVFVVAVILLLLVWQFLTRTRLGWALRAVAQDPDAAQLQGISINKISMIAVGLSGGLAGVAGGLMAPLTRVQPYMGHEVIITAFIVTIVGGIGSLTGAVLAAVLYGFFHVFIATYFGGTIATILGLAIMVLILVVKPTGLLGVGAGASE
jgi:branched-chain amino acid transport system permease protein